ncbi:MAG: hypothetical protein V3W43_10020 [Desulfatiglandaceae bacterium]
MEPQGNDLPWDGQAMGELLVFPLVQLVVAEVDGTFGVLGDYCRSRLHCK